jgi:uncharacterized protein
MAGKFEVYPSGTQWRFRLKAANGEIVAQGESYTTKDGAKRGCEAVQSAADGASIVETDK